MTQESSLTYLNENRPFGEGCTITVVLPLHLPQESPEYLVYINPDETIVDLKTIISAKLNSHPLIEHQKVIFRGRVLENDQKFSSFLNESETDRLHFHVVINNLNRMNSINTSRLRATRPAASQNISTNVLGSNRQPTPILRNNSAPQNNSLELNHEALQNYLQVIRPNFPSNLASVDLIDHHIYYQFVSVNGQAYLVSVPSSAVGQANNSTSTSSAVAPGPQQPFYRRAWAVLLSIWPSIWLAAKLLFFYTFLSSGSSIYKQILLGFVAALIFAFQHGVIDIQIEVIRNQPPDAANPPPVPQAEGLNDTTINPIPAQAPTVSPQPLHPVLEGIRSFLYSLFPARDTPAENPRPQW